MGSNRRHRIEVIDSHTGGEPTRVVLSGGPDLGSGPLAERRQLLAQRWDHFRSAVVNEPRGSDVLVGALLCPPCDPECVTAVIFFNNVGCLQMCGHGLMGVVITLAEAGRLAPGRHRIETPVGVVTVDYAGDHRVTLANVPSYRLAKDVPLRLPDGQGVRGDIAWGGNWFYLVHEHGQELDLGRVESLTAYAWAVRQALHQAGWRGDDGAEIDHIELFGPPRDPRHHSRNFVLCPGKAYDRSPCGTGTSAKLACLIADGQLKPGEIWKQESIVGSVFEAYAEIRDGKIIPWITGTAYVTAQATLVLDLDDPFCWGIRS
jgi:4-hydroxyproline epimerase